MLNQETSESRPSVLGGSQQPPARRGVWGRVVGLVLLAALGVVAWKVYENQQEHAKQSASAAAQLTSRPVPVQVAPVEQKPMPIYLSALGTVTPYMSVTVKARVNGELEPVKFTEGQQVKQGETIMVIDPKPYKAALDQAKGTLAHDEALLKDAQAEYPALQGALSRRAWSPKRRWMPMRPRRASTRAQFKSDKAAIETAQLQLDWCYHPVAHRRQDRPAPGGSRQHHHRQHHQSGGHQPVSADRRLLYAARERASRRCCTSWRRTSACRWRPTTAATCRSWPAGYLLTADNQIDTTTGTDKLKAVFDNKDQSLFPNQFVNIHLVLEDRPNALVVPSAAIQTGTQGSFVWAIDTDAQGRHDRRSGSRSRLRWPRGRRPFWTAALSRARRSWWTARTACRQGQPVTVSAARQQGTGSTSGAARPSDGSATGKHTHKEQQ